MTSILPPHYRPVLDIWETERGIKFIKNTFQTELSAELKLRRVTAPLFVPCGTGLNDNLSGVEQPVSFELPALGQRVEIVQSLAKWKRYALYQHHIDPGRGIYTDMNAIRPDERPDALHSFYVDQWDWEQVITPQDRRVSYLEHCVKRIYAAIKRTEYLVSEIFPSLRPFLPEKIHFVTSEALLQRYPNLSPQEREQEVTRAYGAVFVRGIGHPLSDGRPHDQRSPDYDDWCTPTPDGTYGLNGDILLWNPVLERSFEISSMGIRVSPQSLRQQLSLRGAEDRAGLFFHRLLLDEVLPQTVGGGIGQSRLCMLLLQKAHIGEVQAGIWDAQTVQACQAQGVPLL